MIAICAKCKRTYPIADGDTPDKYACECGGKLYDSLDPAFDEAIKAAAKQAADHQAEARNRPQSASLASCPDCSGQVSKRAITCPHCGAPLQDTGITVSGLKISTYNAISLVLTFLLASLIVCCIPFVLIFLIYLAAK